MKTCLKLLTLLAVMLGVSGYTLPKDIDIKRVAVVHDIHVVYSSLLEPRCELFLRHAVGAYPKGYGGGLCKKYATSKDDDVVSTILPNLQTGIPATPLLKKDLISLDELPAWNGVPPIRASFTIDEKDGGPDPEVNPSLLPYSPYNQVFNYMLFDKEGYEIDPKSRVRTGYRYYEYLGRCYLATIRKPRMYKDIANCKPKEKYPDIPKTIDTTSHPWINIMNQNTVDVGESMPAGVDIFGSDPVKPLVYSDFPIGNDGKVTKGRAMCMADCAPGMLMKLLHAGQSIWGPSGKPFTGKQ